MPPMLTPPGAPLMPGQGNPSMPGQAHNGVPRPMPMPINPQMAAPGSSGTPTSGGPPMFQPPMYQANPTPPTSGGFETSNVNAQSQSQDGDN